MERPFCTRRQRARAALLAGAALLGGCSSGQRAGPEPEVALARNSEAQATFRNLRQRWVSSPLDTRAALERPLTRFVQRFPTDPQGRWARLYLAWINVQRGDLEVARRWLALADAGRPGAASDLSGVVRAALALARGDASRAHDSLSSLQGRLIDADDRLLCLDQLVLAAIAAGRYQEAVLHMLELSAQGARRHRERIWRSLEPRLAAIPLTELEQSLPHLTTSNIQNAAVQPAERAAAVDWMRRAVLELLSRSAIDEQDVALAQRLVMSPGRGAEGGGDSELLRLATRGSLERVIRGRTLGLALELGDPARSQRSIEVAAGISLTLGLASPAAAPDSLALSARAVEAGSVLDALARLSGDGASLLVAGLDAESARQAARFAAGSGLPVLLLHDPGADEPLPRGAYVLGADEQRANEALHAELSRRFVGVLRIGAGAPCPGGAAELEALLASEWMARPRLELDTSAACARAVLMHLTGKRPLVLGFGLDALAAAWGAPADEVWAVGAGRLPLFEGEREPLARQWTERKGRLPTWHEALGHDAAHIAAAVIGEAPAEPLREPESVQAAYRQVEQRLASERFRGLWTATSEGLGFAADQRLPREWRAVRLDGASAAAPPEPDEAR